MLRFKSDPAKLVMFLAGMLLFGALTGASYAGGADVQQDAALLSLIAQPAVQPVDQRAEPVASGAPSALPACNVYLYSTECNGLCTRIAYYGECGSQNAYYACDVYELKHYATGVARGNWKRAMKSCTYLPLGQCTWTCQ